MKNSIMYLLLFIIIGIFTSCSEITQGTIENAPHENAIVVEGFTGSVALNGIDEETSTAWFEVILVIDVGDNINLSSIGDKVTLKFDRSKVDYFHRTKPYRSVLIAEKFSGNEYWSLISVERDY